MRSFYSVLLILLAICLTLASGRTGKHQPGTPVVYGRTNGEALRSGLALPRPKSIPMRCERNNATCFHEQRAPRHRKRQSNPSATVIPASPAKFRRTCTNIRLSSPVDGTLSATCRTQTGSTVSSTFQLKKCLTSSVVGMNCIFMPLDNLWATTCSSCTISGTILTCQCGILIKTPRTTDLSTCIGNNDGVLKCAGAP